MRRLVLATLPFLLFAPATRAQEDTAILNSRLERLERDFGYLQKQVARGGSSGEISTASPAISGSAEVRLAQMGEELRQLRGTLEQLQFSNRQLATDLKKLSDDMEYRLHALEEKSVAAAASATPLPKEPPVETPPATGPSKFDPMVKPLPTPAATKAALTGNDFPDSNAHYSYAFKLLNDKKYPEAASSFDAFVKKYPNDPLTANAFYWLGESYYARGDFTRSAESFRKGFETNPDGQKAPDNLFKLAKSLGQVKRTNEACIVLAQITKKYADAAPRIAKRADDERLVLQCK